MLRLDLLVFVTASGLLAPSGRPLLAPIRDVRSTAHTRPNEDCRQKFADAIVPVSIVYNCCYLTFMLSNPELITTTTLGRFWVVTAAASLTITAVFSADTWRMEDEKKTENRVRRALKRAYTPWGKRGVWSGPEAVKEAVEKFVAENPLFKTLVLVDPTGDVKTELLDEIFRGRKRVLAPSMTTLSLADNLSYLLVHWEKGFLKLDEFVREIGEALLKPSPFERSPSTLPVVVIIDVPSDVTRDQVVEILTESSTFKEKCGGNVITIACLRRDDYDLDELPLDLRNTLQVEKISPVPST